MKSVNELVSVLRKFTDSHNITIVEEENGEFYFAEDEKQIHLGAKEEAMTLEDVYKSFHEGCHSTMLITGREAKSYALEEVVADIAAAKVLSKLGVYITSVYQNVEDIRTIYLLQWENISYSTCWMDRVVKDSDLSVEEIFPMIDEEVSKIVQLIVKEEM